jgi:hypothetical protein
MRRFLSAIVFAAVLILSPGCGPKSIEVQTKAANTIAASVNALTPLLRDMEQKEGNDAIDRAPDKATAKMWLVAIEAKWQPMWNAHKALSIAEDAWAKILEQGGDTTAAYSAVERAFCQLAPLLPKRDDIKIAPIAGVLCSGGNHGSGDGSREAS